MAESVVPVPAATILMLRDDADAGLQVFMVERHHQIDFVAGALVFPGGKVDAGDGNDAVAERMDGADSDPIRRTIQAAAIREAFEECGILLARAAGETALVTATRLAELESYRDAMHSGDVSLEKFLTDENLRLAADQLHHFAHWVTPDMMPKRFDTHFYLAKAPADHLAAHDGHESVDSVWTTPAEAIDAAESGRRSIIFPTMQNILKLARSTTADTAIDAANAAEVVKVTPWTERRDDGDYICIPPEAGYDVSEQKMPPRKPS